MASSALMPDVVSDAERISNSFALRVCLADGIALIVLFVAMSWTLMLRFDDGVVPHDSGTLAHAAERVLHGEWPHRDFDDPYTGLLSFLNAAALSVFGVNLVSLRFVLFPVSIACFLLLYWMVRYAMPPATAALVTATAFAWSVPNYFSAMPTWYNLYCTLFGAAALWMYSRTDRRTWMIAAGLTTGLSFLFKSVGIYFTAIAALFVIFLEQRRSESQPLGKTIPSPRTAWITIVGLGLYVAAVAAVVAAQPHVPEIMMFLAPSAVLASYLAWNERRLRYHDAAGRLKRVLKAGAMFAGGALVPIVLFVTPYVVTGSFGAWWQGVFVTPLKRVSDEHLATLIAEAPFMTGALMLIAVCGVLAVTAKSTKAYVGCGVLCLAALPVLYAGGRPSVYAAVWQGIRLVPLACAMFLCYRLARQRPAGRRGSSQADSSTPWDLAFLFTAAAGVFTLVQFPVAHGIYFLYVAPLVIASSAVVLAVVFPRTQAPVVVCGLVVLGFSAAWVWPGHPFLFGTSYRPADRTTEIVSDRAQVLYDADAARYFSQVVAEVTKRTPAGAPILALPDSPDVYFLTGRTNPTRTFFDVFDADYGTPQRDRRLLELLDRTGVQLVVLRNMTSVSPAAVSPSLEAELQLRFPNVSYVQEGPIRYFTIRWREPAPTTQVQADAPAPGKLLASDRK